MSGGVFGSINKDIAAPSSAGAGLVTMVGITMGIRKLAGKILPDRMTDAWVEEKGMRIKDTVHQIKDDASDLYNQVYRQVDDNFVNAKEVRNALDDLPDSIRRKIVGTEKSYKGFVKIKEVREIRRVLSDLTPDSEFVKAEMAKAPRLKYENFMSSSKKLKQVILDAVPDDNLKGILSQADDRWDLIRNKGSHLIRHVYNAKDDIYKHGNIRKMYISPGAGGERQALRSLEHYNDDVGLIMKDLEALARRVWLRRLGTVTGGLWGLGYLGRSYIRSLLMGASGGGPGPASTGETGG